MYTVKRRIEIDMGHRVPLHGSKCKNIHGHRYVIWATASAPDTIAAETKSSSSGMLIDFGDLKKAMMTGIHDMYDHRLVLFEADELLAWFTQGPHKGYPGDLANFGIITLSVIPTAEELAKVWFSNVKKQLAALKGDKAAGLELSEIEVNETPNSIATYRIELNQEETT